MRASILTASAVLLLCTTTTANAQDARQKAVSYDDLDLTLERKPIAELLCASPIDGHAAFRAWGLGQATTR